MRHKGIVPARLGVILLVFVFGALFTVGASAAVNNRIIAQGVFVDHTGELSLPQVKTKVFKPFKGILNEGYSGASYWIRLRIVPGAPTPSGRLVLRIMPSWLDQVEMFDPLESRARPRITGDRYPLRATDRYRSTNLGFMIPQGSKPRYLYLRLRTTSTVEFYAQAVSPGAAIQLDHRQRLFYLVYLFCLLLFVVWGLVHWSTFRERLMGMYLVQQFFGLLYGVAYIGYLRLYWIDNPFLKSPDHLTSFLIIVFVGIAYIFNHMLLGEANVHRYGLRVFRLAGYGQACVLMVFFLGFIRQALYLDMLGALVMPFVAFATALTANPKVGGWARDRPAISRGALIGYYGLVLAFSSIAAFPAMHITRSVWLSLYVFLVYNMVTGVLMIVFLQMRARRLEKRRSRLRIRLDLEAARAQFERERRLEADQFLSMLAHELRTPLAVLRLYVASRSASDQMRDEAEAAISDINSVIDRSLTTMKVEENIERLHVTEVDLGTLIDGVSATLEDRDRARLSVVGGQGETIRTDGHFLRIVVSNLLDNAVKYGARDREIAVEVARTVCEGLAGIEVKVSNSPGKVGIPNGNEVFKKYFRAASARKYTGSGLGLYLVAQLCRRLGGRVRCEADTDRVSFVVWVPAEPACNDGSGEAQPDSGLASLQQPSA